MEELKDKLHTMILMMKSNRRKILCRYCNWLTTSNSLLERVFNLDDSKILQKDGKFICFAIIHEEGCNGQYDCTCLTQYSERRIKIYFFSPLFAKMISVLPSELYFSMNPNGSLSVTLLPIELYTMDEEVRCKITPVGTNKDEMDKENEREKEYSIEFMKVRDEFNSLICEYLKLAFNEPTLLPPFLLDDEGPTMRLSELIAWLEESE